jgi:DNA-binding response OmpR family regulator
MLKNSFTILLVDDEAAILDFAGKVLEAAGYCVLKAQHSDEALILLDGFQGVVNLLLTDVKMDPFMNGFELAKCVRIIRPETAIMYMSGNLAHAMVQKEVEEARALFIAKPFLPKELIERIGAYLARPLHQAKIP